MSLLNSVFFVDDQNSSQTCTGFDPRKIYMLGEKKSGLKPRGVLQNYTQLKNYYLQNGTLFEDPQFPPDSIVMGDDWQKIKDSVMWLRPKDIVENPKFISEEINRFDVNQGDLGDCWFLAAIADVAQNHKLMELIVPVGQSFHQEYAGIFHFRFWQYGRWIDVVVDDRLPTYKGKLIYLKSKNADEFWTPLLEKAYAKLYGSYKNIEGGYVSEALQDLTGGLTEIYQELLELDKEFDFFDMMMVSFIKKSFMGCGITDTNSVDVERPDGLYTGHAYSITFVTEVKDRDQISNYKLIRIRNPWGQCEWRGKWSDNSSSWDLVGEETRQHLRKIKDDGEFWMQYEDFISNYTLLEICHPNPDSLATAQKEMLHWKSFMIDGAWIANVTCGGLPNNPGRFNFSKNPQYLLTIDGPEKNVDYRILIGLMQKKRRVHNLPELLLGFVVYRLVSTPENARLSKDFFVARKPIYARRLERAKQITGHLRLQNGRYCIIPFTKDTKSNCEFLLRVYSEVDFGVVDNDEEVGLDTGNNQMGISNGLSKADDAIKEVYKSFAGPDEQIGWVELKKILDLLLKAEKQEVSREVCRSMVAMMDTDRSGKLNFHEFFQLWDKIGIWRGIFRNYDLEQSGAISGPELRDALKSADIRINNRILNMLVLRYGNEKEELEMEDFLHCCIKIATMIEIYELNYSKKVKSDDWIIDTVYS